MKTRRSWMVTTLILSSIGLATLAKAIDPPYRKLKEDPQTRLRMFIGVAIFNFNQVKGGGPCKAILAQMGENTSGRIRFVNEVGQSLIRIADGIRKNDPVQVASATRDIDDYCLLERAQNEAISVLGMLSEVLAYSRRVNIDTTAPLNGHRLSAGVSCFERWTGDHDLAEALRQVIEAMKEDSPPQDQGRWRQEWPAPSR